MPDTTTDLASLSDAQLTELVTQLEPSALVALVTQAAQTDREVAEAARRTRHALNLLIALCIDQRPDVNKSELIRTTGIPRRDFYKRPDRL